MDENKLIDKFRGSLVGVAIGDALGMPVETMTPEEILKATGGQGVHGYLAPLQNRISGTRNLRPGDVTDDTLLTFAVARSLINCGGFELLDQAAEFIDEFDCSTLGWGRTTKESAREIKRWMDTLGSEGRHPENPARPPVKPGHGCGNGVAMKITPLGLFYALRDDFPEPFLSHVMSLGLMTHGDPRASFAAAVLGDLIGWLTVQSQPLGQEDLLPKARQRVERTLEILEYRYQFFRDRPEDRLSGRFAALWDSLGCERSLRQRIGTDCFALESVPFAVGVFLRHPQDCRAAVLEAANAGGDTDSTASVVGALVGANLGLTGIPPDLQNGCLARDKAINLADDLYAAAKA